MQQLLNLQNRPDAVYVAGDYAALGALQVLNENNIKIPDEVALVGFGNEPFTDMVTPKITSINQHSAEIGKRAAERFLHYKDHENTQQKLNKIILDAELIVRDSSKKTT
jgi:LacI family transcriptional regulator